MLPRPQKIWKIKVHLEKGSFSGIIKGFNTSKAMKIWNKNLFSFFLDQKDRFIYFAAPEKLEPVAPEKEKDEDARAEAEAKRIADQKRTKSFIEEARRIDPQSVEDLEAYRLKFQQEVGIKKEEKPKKLKESLIENFISDEEYQKLPKKEQARLKEIIRLVKNMETEDIPGQLISGPDSKGNLLVTKDISSWLNHLKNWKKISKQCFTRPDY